MLFLFNNTVMHKNWYAVITADVLYSKTLSSRQKLLIATISNLSNELGFCFARNSFFAEMFNCSKRTIQDDLKQLEDLGFLNRVIKLDSDGKVNFRALTPMRNFASPSAEDFTTPHATDCAYNNKEYNNKSNNLNIIPENQKNDFKASFEKDEKGKFLYTYLNTEGDVVDVYDKTELKTKIKKEKSSAKKEKKTHKNDYTTSVIDCYEKCLIHFPIDLRPTKMIEEVKWLDEIDKLNRLDHLQFSDIILLTKCAREDKFWSKNFLTLRKLRRKNKDGIPHWKLFRENFKFEKSKTQEVQSAYEQAKERLGI